VTVAAAELVGAPVEVIVAAVRAREVSAVEVTQAHLAAVAAREPDLHAWALVADELALAAARAVDDALADGAEVGPLAGVPFGVKDIVDVAGMPTRNGARLPLAGVATSDAAAVARLRAAGAVPLGKTVTTEYALFEPGPTVHPLDPTRTPGGSSSGSAVAVAAGTVPLAIGTQTAGSIVRPAAFCGVVGAKPTIGAVPRDGVTLCSPTLDTVGLLGVDVSSVTVGLRVMADQLGAVRPVLAGSRSRIGFLRTPEWEELEPSTRDAVEHGVERLSSHLDVVELATPDWMVGLTQAQLAVMAVECTEQLAPLRDQHGHLFSERLRAFLRVGDGFGWAYAAATHVADEARGQLDELFADVDVLLAPAVLGEAPPRDTTGDPLLCRMWTLLGTPTVAVPGLRGPSGLPLGVQVVAAPGRDAEALRAADVVAAALRTPGADATSVSP
jgi:Asp-tRNA(Asn)/Glu-tRNA(Gln) amidotransferase A subunit family amidase